MRCQRVLSGRTHRALCGVVGLSLAAAASPVRADGLLSPQPLADPIDALEATALDQNNTDGSRGMSPKLKAMMLSLLVPGLGQYTSGNHTAGYLFFGAEAAIWATNLAFNLQGDSRSDRYEEFAGVWGGVEAPGGHDDTYYTNLGRYTSYDEYRVVAIRSEGDLYEENQHWVWPSDERRNRYLDLRGAAEDSYQRSEFMFAAALLNRALSMVHAARTVEDTRPNAAAGHSLQFNLRPEDGQLTPLLAWQLRF